MAYTIRNSRFGTNTEAGSPHGEGQPGGSVFREPLYPAGPWFEGEWTLWLEHVVDHKTAKNGYWLAWYDEKRRSQNQSQRVLKLGNLINLGHKLINVPEAKLGK